MAQVHYIQEAARLAHARLHSEKAAGPEEPQNWTPKAALKALSSMPEAFWAYPVLADTTNDLDEKEYILSRGVAAATALLGPEGLQDVHWGDVVYRDIIRVRIMLGTVLWAKGDFEGAIREMEIAEAQCGDVQMDAASYLVGYYVATGRMDRLAGLCMNRLSGTEAAVALHAQALLKAVLASDTRSWFMTKTARNAVVRALEANRHVLPLLITSVPPTDGLAGDAQELFTPGDKAEARNVAKFLWEAWHAVPGGIEMLTQRHAEMTAIDAALKNPSSRRKKA